MNKKYKINVNKVNISSNEYWRLMKNYSLIFRLLKAEIINIRYKILYGGREISNTYNLYSITIKKK